jgi:hypothetical protein
MSLDQISKHIDSYYYAEPTHPPAYPQGEFIPLLERTILLLERLSSMSPVFCKNAEVLRHAQRDVINAQRRE